MLAWEANAISNRLRDKQDKKNWNFSSDLLTVFQYARYHSFNMSKDEIQDVAVSQRNLGKSKLESNNWG